MNLTMQNAVAAAAVRDQIRTEGYGSGRGEPTSPSNQQGQQSLPNNNNNVLSPNNQQQQVLSNGMAIAALYNQQQMPDASHLQAHRSHSTGSSGSGERVTPGNQTQQPTPLLQHAQQPHRHSSGDNSVGPMSPNLNSMSPSSAAQAHAAVAAAAVGMNSPFGGMDMSRFSGGPGPSTSMGGLGMGMGGQHPGLMTYGMNMAGFPLRHPPASHMGMCQKRYPCKLCAEQFDSKAELQMHTQYHMREAKPYKCTRCTKQFDSKAELQVHTQYHMREAKPYKCSHCPKHFANSSYLSQHMRIHLGIKPFGPCEYCGRKFTQLSHLQQHIRTHTGDKPYKCKVNGCEKKFSQLSNLQSHSRCHQTDKPFKCNSCYKCFSDEQSLLDHIPKHKDSKHLKVHICRLCGKSYTQGTYLAKHMTKHADRRDQLRLRDMMLQDEQSGAPNNMWPRASNGMVDHQSQLFASMHHQDPDASLTAQLPFNSFPSHGGMQVSQSCTYTPPAISGMSAAATGADSAFTRLNLGAAFARQAGLSSAGPSSARPSYFTYGDYNKLNSAGHAGFNTPLLRLEQIRDFHQTGAPAQQASFDLLKRDSGGVF